jgi:hypothetical protein
MQRIESRPIGREGQVLTVVDGFSADPDALRHAASATVFGPPVHHYPGLRAPLPTGYLDQQLPVIAAALGRSRITVVDASFSMVTTPPAALTVRQRVPHCDAFTADRIALVHFLSPQDGDGTAFFRHRSTGFELVNERRAPIFFDQLEAEMRLGGVPEPAYVAESTPLFERIALAEARYDRALLYPGWLLHSGAISPGASLSADPAIGRLTVTAFLTMG